MNRPRRPKCVNMAITREETKNWLKQAEDDFGTAEVCLKNGRFNASAFHSQQAAEKALKALQIQKLGRFDRAHDLVALASTVNAPPEIMTCCIRLTPYYTVTRYPDVGRTAIVVVEDTGRDLLEKSRRVTEWVKQTLKQ